MPNHFVDNPAGLLSLRLVFLMALITLTGLPLKSQTLTDQDFDALVNEGHMLMRKGQRKASFDTLFYSLNQAKKQESDKYFDVLTALTFHLYYSDTYGELYLI